jgi:hypothetical protein
MTSFFGLAAVTCLGQSDIFWLLRFRQRITHRRLSHNNWYRNGQGPPPG